MLHDLNYPVIYVPVSLMTILVDFEAQADSK